MICKGCQILKKCRILTDIGIAQNPEWEQKTDLIENLSPILTAQFASIPPMLAHKIRPLLNLLAIITHIRKYDAVITADIKTAQLFALLRRTFFIRKPRHIVLELMLDEEDRTTTWKMKRMIQRFLFSSVDVIFVSASQEVEAYAKRFNLPKSLFKFIHFHTNIIEPKMFRSPNGYILSAGRTGRDFHTHVEAARALPMKFVIISDQQSAKGINPPDNVSLFIDIPRQDYLEFVKECSFVVVPLQNLVKSTGQVVILEAMAYGKPVVSTDTVGTRDYILSGFNGILVPPNDPISLRKAICQLANDHSLQENLSRNAFNFVKENCTFDIYVKKILDTVEALA